MKIILICVGHHKTVILLQDEDPTQNNVDNKKTDNRALRWRPLL